MYNMYVCTFYVSLVEIGDMFNALVAVFFQKVEILIFHVKTADKKCLIVLLLIPVALNGYW